MVGILIPKLHKFTRIQSNIVIETILIIAGVAFLAILAQTRVYLGFSPVPLTGQTLAVLLIGYLYGFKRGITTVLLYLVLGIFGFPVFSGGSFGPAHLLGPTGGYLAGFILSVAFIGYISDRGWFSGLARVFFVFLLGNAIIYLAGLPVLSLYVGGNNSIQLGLLPFLVGDLIKIILATGIVQAARKVSQSA
jgi:biotin transport system substrate-specific component